MANWRSEILIDGEVIWSTVSSVPKQDLEFDVSAYRGDHELEFRIVKLTSPPSPEVPCSESLFSSWWYFDGSNDWLEMLDPTAEFTPAGDFTVLAVVEPATLISSRFMFSKWSDIPGGPYNNQKSWEIHQVSNDNRCYISHDGNAISGRSIYNHCVIGQKYLFAMVYKYVGASNSEMIAYHINSLGTFPSTYYYAAKGPVFPGVGKVYVGATETSSTIPDSPWHGKIFCVAYYDGLLSTQAQLEDIWNEVITPCDLNPKIYMDFHKPVASTYTSDVGNYVFDVYGSPVKNGL